MKMLSRSVLFLLVSFAGVAQGDTYYKCIETEDSEAGILLRALDKPLGPKRFVAMVKSFSGCSFPADTETGCKSVKEDNVLLAVECGSNRNRRIHLRNDLSAEMSIKLHHKTAFYELACRSLQKEDFMKERTKLTNCSAN